MDMSKFLGDGFVVYLCNHRFLNGSKQKKERQVKTKTH